MVLFDAGAFFSQVVADPTAHGFVVSDDSCLDLADDTPLNYLFPHALRTACAEAGTDSYVFWDQTHPTTALHERLAEAMLQAGLASWAP